MSSEGFRQLGKDLLAFADSPETTLGVFKGLSLEGDPLHARHVRKTRRWEIIWTRYLNSAASADFTWRLLNGTSQLQHALLVAKDEDSKIQRLVLSYAVLPEAFYEIHYEVDRDGVQPIMFTMRSTRSTELKVFGEAPTPLKDVLKYVPVDMTPSFGRVELAAVSSATQ